MPTNVATLLPPNATPLERALEASTARIGDVPAPLAQLWDPATCAAELLPWLAWGLSVDNWDPAWPVATKREIISSSIENHRRKGTPATIDAVLATFDSLLTLVEWHEAVPPKPPHTFEVQLELVTADGVAPGGPRASAAFAEAVIRDVTRVKRLSQHLTFVQKLTVSGAIGLAGAANVARFDRYEGEGANDPDPIWLTYLQTEAGEPLQAENGDFLVDVG